MKKWIFKKFLFRNFNFILCNFSVRTLQCKKKILIFCPWKIEKTSQKSCSESTQTPFSHGPAQASAHSPKLISHFMKFRDQTSVLLFVLKVNLLFVMKFEVWIFFEFCWIIDIQIHKFLSKLTHMWKNRSKLREE